MRKIINNPFIGGIFLIAGTTLGVGMLAFPVTTSYSGFFPSTLLFLLIWFLMLSSAYFFLDANLSIKGQTNMITMAEKRLGVWGKVVSWVVYLLLLYSLTAVYIAGCSPLIAEAFQDLFNITLPSWLVPFSLPLIFGGFIYSGTRGVDLVNRIFMFALIVSYVFLIFFVPSETDFERLTRIDFRATIIAIPAVITAFGYHIIIPSLVTYMDRDRKKLRKVILIGSIIPICVYLLWQVLVIGAIPFPMLTEAYENGVPATQPLARVLRSPLVSLAAKLFSFFAIVTSFIGVTLSLSDFLTDGFKIKRTHGGRILAILLSFIPPLFFVFTYQRGFYVALQYAGAFVAILLVFLPAAMVWKLKPYQTIGKRLFLILAMLSGILIVYLDILEEAGKLKTFVNPSRK